METPTFLSLPNGDCINIDNIKAIRLVDAYKGTPPRIQVDCLIGQSNMVSIIRCESDEARNALAKELTSKLRCI